MSPFSRILPRMKQPVSQIVIARRSCWAECLNDCEGPLSREHVISAGVFDEIMLHVEGIHAFGNESKVVSTANLTARMLCKDHNSRLSPLDVEAARLSNAIKAARAGSDPVTLRVSGALLERWALKSLVNLLASRWTEMGRFPPGPDIVAKVFGLAPISAPSGLYALLNYQGTAPPDSVFYAVITSQHESSPHVLGLLISLSGMVFALSICRSPLDQVLRGHSPFGPFDTADARTAHRPVRMQMGDRSRENLTLTVEFDWSGTESAGTP